MQDCDGNTALHCAAVLPRASVLRALLATRRAANGTADRRAAALAAYNYQVRLL